MKGSSAVWLVGAAIILAGFTLWLGFYAGMVVVGYGVVRISQGMMGDGL